MKMDNKMAGIEALSKNDMKGLKKEFEDIGFKVTIGG